MPSPQAPVFSSKSPGWRMLVRSRFLNWVLITQMCTVCENPSNLTLACSHFSVCRLHFQKQLKEKNLAGEFSCGNSVSPALNRMKESLTMILNNLMGLPRWLSDKESFCSAGDVGSIPGWARYPREGNGLPLQDSCLENPMDRRAWWATVHGVAESWTQPSD